jgi:ribosomal protein S18 acetylase RimI-like enzyme
VSARARDWHHGRQAAICDVKRPWAHGTVLRATRYPSYYSFNLVRVEDHPGMGVEALVAFADKALAGLEHRRVDFDVAAAAEPLRAGFEAGGWDAERLVWMRHEAAPPPGRELPVEELPYDAVAELRLIWHREDSPEEDPSSLHAQAREVAMLREARVLAVREGGVAVAYAQLERDGPAAEITQVYVHPERRGAGLGTAMTRAAIAAAGDVQDLWIVADDEDRPKHLYARLGFRPAWTTMEFERPLKVAV